MSSDINNYGGEVNSTKKGSPSFLGAFRSPSEGRFRPKNNYSDQKIVIRRSEIGRRSEDIQKKASLPDIHARNNSNFSSLENLHPYRDQSSIRSILSSKIITTMYN